jgi:hypothetical protein
MQTAPAIDLTTMNYLLYEKRRWNWGRMGQNASIASRKKNLKNKARNKRAFEKSAARPGEIDAGAPASAAKTGSPINWYGTTCCPPVDWLRCKVSRVRHAASVYGSDYETRCFPLHWLKNCTSVRFHNHRPGSCCDSETRCFDRRCLLKRPRSAAEPTPPRK